jgi:hypothetical protein
VADTPLTPGQEAQAQRPFQPLQQPFLEEARRFARLLASKPDGQRLGETEFEVRPTASRPRPSGPLFPGGKRGGARAPA